METQRNTAQKPPRKFHDAWALVLFGIVTATTNVLMLVHDHSKARQADLNVLYRVSVSALLFSMCFALATLVCFRLIPKIVLHLSFVFSILFSVLLIFLIKNPIGMFFGLIFTAVSVYFYLYWGMRYIPFTSVVLKASTKIILGNLSQILFVEVVASALFIANIALAFFTLISMDINTEYYFHVLFVFEVLWIHANSFYFFVVFVSSILSIHLFNTGRNVRIFVEAVGNTLYACGSICLGGLLLAVVQTMRYLLYLTQSEDRRNGTNRNIASKIISFVLELVLEILEDVIKFANDWVFVYVAIYGKSYKKSLQKSFEKLVDNDNKMLLNSLVVDKALWFFGIVGALFYLLCLSLSVDVNALLGGKSVLEVAVPSVFVSFFIMTFLSIFSAGTKTVLFVYSEKRECVDSALPEVTTAIKKLQEEGK